MRWLLLLGLIFIGVAYAQPQEAEGSVEALAQAGAEAYRDGDYAKAVGFYIKAHQLQPNAPLVYNIALIYERKIQDPELAIQFYRRYIGSEDVDPNKIPEVNARIQKLKAEIEAKKRAALVAPPPKEGDPGVGVGIGAATPPPTSSNLGPWLLIGAGAALTLTGAVFGGLASGEADDFSAAEGLDDKLDHRDAGQTYALTADALMGAGVLSLGIGALFLFSGGDQSVGFLPQADGGLLMMGGEL
ncbi:hypothetical protein KKB55_20680 [Myxococcota bacterium]|nr:hypothetical protein [Myxococcota bacterium]MBU1900165.1 hypothetical protein [Myxococcota bacterium]